MKRIEYLRRVRAIVKNLDNDLDDVLDAVNHLNVTIQWDEGFEGEGENAKKESKNEE